MSVGHHAFNFRSIPFRAGWSPHVSRVSPNPHTRLERVDRQSFLRLDTICSGGFEHNPSLETVRCVMKRFGHCTRLNDWPWIEAEGRLTCGWLYQLSTPWGCLMGDEVDVLWHWETGCGNGDAVKKRQLLCKMEEAIKVYTQNNL